MKRGTLNGAAFAAAWMMSTLGGWAGENAIFGNPDTDVVAAYDAEHHLLLVLGDRSDNHIEVAPGDHGEVLINGQPFAVEGEVRRFKETPIVAIHGGGGNDILIGHLIPILALCGGEGTDMMGWDMLGRGSFGPRDAGSTYDGDWLVWNSSAEDGGQVVGGAGLDVLIGNTAGDRLHFGDLGNDWIVGGTGVDSEIGDWGQDWLSGGTGVDGADVGGWGNDLLNADDVMTVQETSAYDPQFRGGVYVATGD